MNPVVFPPIFLQEAAPAAKDAQADAVVARLVDLIGHAESSICMAVYDVNITGAGRMARLQDAFAQASQRKVEIKIAYFNDPPRNVAHSGGVAHPDLTPGMVDQLLSQAPGAQSRPIDGLGHLMHNKYMIIDGHTEAATVWTGSTNFTTEAWANMENNIWIIRSPGLAAYYQNDFAELWANGNIKGAGAVEMDHGTTTVEGVPITVNFAPGQGRQMDQLIATQISAARQRVVISTMVLSSATVLGALADAINQEQVTELTGIYDATETLSALKQSHTGTPALFEVIKPHLVGKHSLPFNPDDRSKANWMHNKIIVCDDTVLTGSFNFSRNATNNGENMLLIQDKTLADTTAAYIRQLVSRYGQPH